MMLLNRAADEKKKPEINQAVFMKYLKQNDSRQHFLTKYCYFHI